jgi:hypothetical protein
VKHNFSIVFFFLTGFLFAQEFGATFFTIDESSLPQVFTFDNSYFVQKHTTSTFPKSMGITSSNYWQPVSMLDALNKQDAYLNRRNTVENKITAESLGFRRQTTERESTIRFEVRDPYFETSRGVRNTVYRDASMPFFYNPFYYRPAPGSNF